MTEVASKVHARLLDHAFSSLSERATFYRATAEGLVGFDVNTTCPRSRCLSVVVPVLVVADSRDDHTTPAESLELFAAAAEPMNLCVVAGARHQDFLRL